MKSFSEKIKRGTVIPLVAMAFLVGGCNIVKKESRTPALLQTENAPREHLMDEVNRFARVSSLRAKVDLKFEDNSFAEFGMKESYRHAPGEIVVQRPGHILLKVQMPVIGSDIAQMTSDGQKFRVAILQDDAGGKYKKFVKGTNNADYSVLQKGLKASSAVNGKVAKENVNAFANLRPQHFTEAMLVRPIDPNHFYTQTSIHQVEEDESVNAKSPLRRVMRGYYLLDEYSKQDDGSLKILRRFWFDRVGVIRLARQQIFDVQGEIESDIIYGKEGTLTETDKYRNLPLEIQVTRPKERYSMKVTYQAPSAVMIGNEFPAAAFTLENKWNLEEVDLDRRLAEAVPTQPSTSSNRSSVTRFQ
jgi:hypothetical protein